MTDAEIVAKLADRSVVALTLWAEARGEGLDGLVAVGCVIRNRAEAAPRWPATLKGVCLQSRQFSCWTPGPDVNHARLMAQAERIVMGLPVTDRDLVECLYLADGLLSGTLIDRTKGANHYWAPLAMSPAGRVPDWAKGHRPLTMGRHKFLTL